MVGLLESLLEGDHLYHVANPGVYGGHSEVIHPMTYPGLVLLQKVTLSVGLNRITDKLIPSVDWKKSFNKSLTHTWGSRACLSQAWKIWTKRLYFSHQHTLLAMVVVAGVLTRDPTVGLTMVSSWPAPPMVLPAAPRRGKGLAALTGSSFTVLDPPGMFDIWV